MTTNKKSAKKAPKSTVVTPAELKQWLNGILEFQPDEFAPTPGQWAVIRDKIFALEDFPASLGPQHAQTFHYQNGPQVVQSPQAQQPYVARPIAEVEEPYQRGAIAGVQDDPNLVNTRVNIGGAASTISNEHGGISVQAQTDEAGNYVTSFV